MPRGPRLVLPEVALHLVQRGVNRQPCFFSDRELNPVRAGMVKEPGDYPWSSHLSNAGALPHPMLSAHVAYESLGDAPEQRSSAYRALFDVELPGPDIEEIRKATRGGYCVGEARRPPGRPPRNQSTLPSV